MIAPAYVEGYLTMAPEIAQAMVFGDRHPYLVAVIVPDADFAPEPGEAAPDVQKAIAAAVARVNRDLPASARVRRFMIAAEAFTIANGQLTPTLKIKRHAIGEAYGVALEALYDGRSIAA
jgi:long-chain acyl-CoA synthetase